MSWLGQHVLLKRPDIHINIFAPCLAPHSTPTLWVSHQSTLGRPVSPAAFRTWVGFTCTSMRTTSATTQEHTCCMTLLEPSNQPTRSISEITAALSSSLQLANSNLAPCCLRYWPTKPPIQPVRPNIRNTCRSEPVRNHQMRSGVATDTRADKLPSRPTNRKLSCRSYCTYWLSVVAVLRCHVLFSALATDKARPAILKRCCCAENVLEEVPNCEGCLLRTV